MIIQYKIAPSAVYIPVDHFIGFIVLRQLNFVIFISLHLSELGSFPYCSQKVPGMCINSF